MNIDLRVKNLVRKCGTSNPFMIAETFGIKVVFLPLPASIRGFFVRVLRRKYIVINQSLSEIAAFIVACHELGHVRLHLGYGYYFDFSGTYYVKSRREREANEYATHLLSHSYDIDHTLLSKIINEKRPDPKLVHQILSEFITTGF
jgi:Predicted Zn peptidase